MSTVHTECVGVVHHQAINVLCTLNRSLVALRECRIALRPGDSVLQQIGSKWINRQRGINGRLLMRYVLHHVSHVLCAPRWHTDRPDLFGHVITAVTGVTGHTCAAHVSAPIFIRVLRHGNHDPRYLFGVEGVCFKTLASNVTVVAALVRRYPLGNRGHQSGEFSDRQVP